MERAQVQGSALNLPAPGGEAVHEDAVKPRASHPTARAGAAPAQQNGADDYQNPSAAPRPRDLGVSQQEASMHGRPAAMHGTPTSGYLDGTFVSLGAWQLSWGKGRGEQEL